MLHGVVTLGFALVAAGSALLIWTMLSENRVAILAALGIAPVANTPRTASRRVRVRSTQSASPRQDRMRRAA